MKRLLELLGGIGLFGAVAVDFSGVIGRFIRHPMMGSIELMQAFILVTSSIALVSATLAGKHATVRMLTDRLSGRRLQLARQLHALLFALFFAALALASAWLIWDLAGGHEESELLHIPLQPLRLLCAACIVSVAVVQLYQAVRGAKS